MYSTIEGKQREHGNIDGETKGNLPDNYAFFLFKLLSFLIEALALACLTAA
jgi:hypothetical protein